MLFKVIGCFFVILSFSSCAIKTSIDIKQQVALQKEATSIIQQFANTLKPQLKQALQHGGPAYAIETCSKAAPLLTTQLSKQTGWSIKRVSLKARNHHTAIPNSWEKSVLQQFNRDQADGKSPSTMQASRIENGTYQFMKAQSVTPICLLCHGENLKPDVAAALKKYYPQDQARYYKLGQIRGAFSLTKQL